MGYYTEYSMEIMKADKTTFNQLEVDLFDQFMNKYFQNCINPFDIFELIEYNNDTVRAYQSDTCKWYDHDEDMDEISKRYPNWVFCLSGNGEATDDFWKTYYHNGQHETCTGSIVYETPCVITWPNIC